MSNNNSKSSYSNDTIENYASYGKLYSYIPKEGSLPGNREAGVQLEFYPNGVMSAVAPIKDNACNGLVKYYHTNGALGHEAIYYHGRLMLHHYLYNSFKVQKKCKVSHCASCSPMENYVYGY